MKFNQVFGQKLFSQSFEELVKCSQNISGGKTFSEKHLGKTPM